MDSFYGDFAFPQFTFLPPHVPVQVVIFANRLEVDCKNKNFNKRFSFFLKRQSVCMRSCTCTSFWFTTTLPRMNSIFIVYWRRWRRINGSLLDNIGIIWSWPSPTSALDCSFAQGKKLWLQCRPELRCQ